MRRRPGERCRRAFEVSPSDVVPIWILVDRGLERSPNERIEWLEFLGERSRDGVTASQYLNLAGQLAAHDEGDTLRGLRLFQQALAKDPAHGEAADEVESILHDLGQEYALATFYRERLAETTHSGKPGRSTDPSGACIGIGLGRS